MSWQQKYQPFSDGSSSNGGGDGGYPQASTAPPPPPGQQQYQQHQQRAVNGGMPQPPQPQPIQHQQRPDPSTYAQAGYHQPGQGSQGVAESSGGSGQPRSHGAGGGNGGAAGAAQASRKSSGQGGDEVEYGNAESGSSATGSKETDATFEFMRRKKWAQLLIEELHDTAIIALLPLSNGGFKIMYASSGIKDLTGHSSKELENLNLSEIVHEPDLPALTSYINQSIATRVDLASYHRFKCIRPPPPRHTDSSASDVSDSSTDVVSSRGTRSSVNDGSVDVTRPVLMEVRGHGFWGEEAERLPVPVSLSLAQPPRPTPSDGSTSRPSLTDTRSGSFMGAPGPRCKAFFLMVRRWPSPAAEMASTFLAEKIENERLRAELLSLEGGDGTALPPPPPPPLLDGEPAFAAGSGPGAYPFHPQLRHQHSYGSAYDDSAIGGGAYDDDDSDKEYAGGAPPTSRAGPSSQQQQQAQQGAQQQQQATVVGKEHPSELGKKSKKSKKSKEEGNYVCVTCGRTDSPEWRKGPLGPKTLCNACGLRYAKKQQMAAAADGTGPPVPPKKKSAPKPPAPGPGDGQAGQQ